MSTAEKRRPLNIAINGHDFVSSSEHYTVGQAADIQRMLVDVLNKVTDCGDDARATLGALQIVKDVSR